MYDKASRDSLINNPLREVVLENALDAVVAMDSANVVIDWNKQAEKIFGWNKGEVVGSPLAEIIIPPEFRTAHYQGLETFLRTGMGPILNKRIEVLAINRTGKLFPVELTVIPVPIDGSFIFYSFIRDITERKSAEKELLLRSEMIEHSLNGIDIIDSSGKFIYANPSYLRMWGYGDVSEVLGTSPVSHCADPTVPEKIISELKSNGSCDIEFVARRKDGSLFDVRMLARLAHDTAGNEIYPTTCFDVTDQKRAREALKKSERLYHSTFSKAPVGILNTGVDGRFINVNTKFCEMLGYDREELREITFMQLTHPEDRALDEVMFREMKAGIRPIYDREKRYLRKDGSVLWVHVIGELLRDDDGVPTHSVTIVKDISDRKKAEEKKSILEKRLRILSELSRNLLENPLSQAERLQSFVRSIVPQVADWCVVDIIDESGDLKIGAISHRDPDKVKLVHRIREKFPNAKRDAGPYRVIASRQPELVKVIDSTVLRNMSENEEHLNVLKSLGIKSYICVPIVAHGKNLGAFTMASETNNFDTSDLGFAEDLATRAALSLYNSNLYQSAHEALQARDEFLSIASHELKTPLTTLKLQAQLQSRLLKEDASGSLSSDRLATYLDKSEGLVNRLDRLIDDMLDISRIRTGKLTINKERVNLSAVTKEVVDRLQSQSVAATGHRISFQAPEVLNCDVDVMRIEQVITNLVQNALKYGQGKSVDVTLSLESDSFVFSVSDKGMGISEENQLKIFQRFERVSDTSGISGLGLGLYISHQIVKAHGGEIWVVSNLGQGSTFFVRLPEMTFS